MANSRSLKEKRKWKKIERKVEEEIVGNCSKFFCRSDWILKTKKKTKRLTILTNNEPMIYDLMPFWAILNTIYIKNIVLSTKQNKQSFAEFSVFRCRKRFGSTALICALSTASSRKKYRYKRGGGNKLDLDGNGFKLRY